MMQWTEEEWTEWRLEREAIMEIDGGLSRVEAMRAAGYLVALERVAVRSEAIQAAKKTPADDQMEMFANTWTGAA